MLFTGLTVTYSNNTVLSNMLLKLEIVSLLNISALKEFQSVNVHGLNCWGNKVVTTDRSSMTSRSFKVVWQGDGDFMVYDFVEDRHSCNCPSILEGGPVKCGQHTSNTGFSRIIMQYKTGSWNFSILLI